MGRVDFDAKNRVQTTNFDFPKLKLKNGERARIYVLESPVLEYVHELRKPKIVDGVPKMGTEKKRDGTEYQDYVRDFVGSPLCLGREDILDDKGADPDTCPMCAYAKQFPDRIKAPKRRYAMHVIRYKTKNGGFQPITPFSVELLVWAFSATVFNKIIDFQEEWAEQGGLKKHDLSLGPCENEGFQKFDINVLPDVAWANSEEKKALVIDTYKNNQIPDLSIACGNRKDRRWIDIDLEAIQEAWAVIDASGTKPGSVGASSPAASSTALTEDLSSLLDETPGETVETVTTPEPVVVEDTSADDLDSLLPEDEPAAEAPAEEKKEESGKVDDFDDLLGNLDLS